mgnify:CR=1 FL=1
MEIIVHHVPSTRDHIDALGELCHSFRHHQLCSSFCKPAAITRFVCSACIDNIMVDLEEKPELAFLYEKGSPESSAVVFVVCACFLVSFYVFWVFCLHQTLSIEFLCVLLHPIFCCQSMYVCSDDCMSVRVSAASGCVCFFVCPLYAFAGIQCA